MIMEEFELEGVDAFALAIVIGLLFGGLAASGCAKEQKIPDPAPVPTNTSFEGVWYSPQFKHMYLRQNGKRVEGVYTYQSGGTLEGKIDGNLLVFEWVDKGSKQTATRTLRGHGYLQLVRKDKLRLNGEWGYESDHTGAGPWEAVFIRELESDDPETVEEALETDEETPSDG